MDNTELPHKHHFPWAYLLLTFIAVCAVASFMHYSAGLRAGGQQVYDNLAVFGTRLDNLENSVALHEKRIKDLENAAPKPAAATATPAPAATNDDRIDQLQKEVAALKSGMPAPDADKAIQSIRMLSAFHRLSDKVLSGKPFAAELQAFEEAAKPDETAGSPLATLAPYADSGIPTLATLLTSFDQSVESLKITESVPPAEAGFWERLIYNFTHMVSIRRISDTQNGTSTDAIIGRAQAHLEAEEIEAAMAEIKSLPESERGNFAAWADDAQMVTETPSLTDQIEEQVMEKAFSAGTHARHEQPSLQTPGQ